MTDVMNPNAQELTLANLNEFMGQCMTLMKGMADMIRSTNERMTSLEQQVRMLEKLTPAQATELNAMIRERAAAVCEEYRMAGMETQVAAAIRKAVRTTTGARSVRDIARCDYRPVRDQIAGWDEYRTIKAIKAKGARA